MSDPSPADLDHVLRFRPMYQDYLWGGRRLAQFRDGVPATGPVAESWEVSTRPEGMSVVADGPLAGTPLEQLAPDFPLLFKVLDAARDLSLQVHPDDAAAAAHGGQAKSEMWYILDADDGAGVYCGFKPGVTPAEYDEALAAGKLEEILGFHEVRAGDAVWVPGGRVHAIAAGCLLYEVQQNSNTTYRLHDWNRVGADGQPRQLHLEQGRRVIRWQDPEPVKVPREVLPGVGDASCERVLECEYFRMERWNLPAAGSAGLPVDERHRVVFALDAGLQLDAVEQPRFTSALVPAGVAARVAAGPGSTALLVISF